MAKLKAVHPGEILREEFMEPRKLNRIGSRWRCECLRRASTRS